MGAATFNLLEPLLSHVGFAALETADLRSSFATLLATLACHGNAPSLRMIAVPDDCCARSLLDSGWVF